MSRSFGDFYFKSNTALPFDQQQVTCNPEITVEARTAHDEFILIACDGIWGEIENQEAVAFVRERLLVRPIAYISCALCLYICMHMLAYVSYLHLSMDDWMY